MGIVSGVDEKGGFIPTGCLAVCLSQILGPSIALFSVLGLKVLGQQGLGAKKKFKTPGRYDGSLGTTVFAVSVSH